MASVDAKLKRIGDQILYEPLGLSQTIAELIEELLAARRDGYTHVWMDGTHYSISAAIRELGQWYHSGELVGVVRQVSLPQRKEFESD